MGDIDNSCPLLCREVDNRLKHLIETKKMIQRLGFSPKEIQAKIDSRKQVLKRNDTRQKAK